MKHTVIVALSLNSCVFNDRGQTWVRLAWDVVAGPWAEALAGPDWTAGRVS